VSAEQNQTVLRRVIEEVFDQGNYDLLDTLLAPNFQEHQFGLQKTLDGLKQDIQHLRAAFPDIRHTIEDVVADGDKVWMRMTARGTNTGPFIGPPTGKAMTITVIDVCRFENGKIVEHWGVPDQFALMAQLGLLPQATN